MHIIEIPRYKTLRPLLMRLAASPPETFTVQFCSRSKSTFPNGSTMQAGFFFFFFFDRPDSHPGSCTDAFSDRHASLVYRLYNFSTQRNAHENRRVFGVELKRMTGGREEKSREMNERTCSGWGYQWYGRVIFPSGLHRVCRSVRPPVRRSVWLSVRLSWVNASKSDTPCDT